MFSSANMDKSFHNFGSLPPEIRTMIWEYSLPEVRVYEIMDVPGAKQKMDPTAGLMFANVHDEPPPSLASVCSESRAFVLKRYRPLTLCRTTKYVDLSRDLLLLEPYLLSRRLHRALQFMSRIPLIRDHLVGLALGTSYGIYTGICHPILSWRGGASGNGLNTGGIATTAPPTPPTPASLAARYSAMTRLLTALTRFPRLKTLLFVVHQEFQFAFAAPDWSENMSSHSSSGHSSGPSYPMTMPTPPGPSSPLGYSSHMGHMGHMSQMSQANPPSLALSPPLSTTATTTPTMSNMNHMSAIEAIEAMNAMNAMQDMNSMNSMNPMTAASIPPSPPLSSSPASYPSSPPSPLSTTLPPAPGYPGSQPALPPSARPQVVHQAYRFKFDVEANINRYPRRRPHVNELLFYPLADSTYDRDRDDWDVLFQEARKTIEGIGDGNGNFMAMDDSDWCDPWPTNDDWRRFKRSIQRAVIASLHGIDGNGNGDEKRRKCSASNNSLSYYRNNDDSNESSHDSYGRRYNTRLGGSASSSNWSAYPMTTASSNQRKRPQRYNLPAIKGASLLWRYTR